MQTRTSSGSKSAHFAWVRIPLHCLAAVAVLGRDWRYAGDEVMPERGSFLGLSDSILFKTYRLRAYVKSGPADP